MYEASKMLTGGIVIFFIAICAAVFLLIYFKRHKIINQETQFKLGKIFSVTPFVVNIAIPIVLLTACLPLEEIVLILLGTIVLYTAGASAVIGPATALLGLHFSVSCAREQKKAFKKYIVFSIISMVISLLYLTIYLSVLIPYSIRYYGSYIF